MDAKAEFNQAVSAARQKDFQSARTLLRDILKEDPHYVDAWILFAHVAQNREHAIYCFERALFLDHDNTYVRQQLARLRAAGEPISQQASPPERNEPAEPGSVHPREPISQPVANVSLLKSEPDKPKKKMSALEIILLAILAVAVLILIGILGVNALQGGDVSAIFSAKPTLTNDIYFEAIYENIRATNAEDIDLYISTIHPDSPGYQQTAESIPNAFAAYDLSVNVYGLEVVEKTGSEVQVAFTMESHKIRGPGFRDNRVYGIFILRPDDGVWKIYNQKVERVEYLD
jgi:tetratricopeptide (TPR) repeat protein